MLFGRLDRSFLNLELESFKIIFKKVTLTGVIFYTFMLILSAFYAGYYVLETVDEYLNSPMNTEFNIVTANQMILPQIYVCSPIKVTRSFYEQNADLYRKAELLRSIYFGKSFDLDTTEENLTSILDMTAENMHALYRNMTTDPKKFWIATIFRKILVSFVDWSELVTQVFDPQYGICYVVDVGSEYKQLYHSEALAMAIDLNSAEYPMLESGAVPEFLGVKVFIAEKIDPTSGAGELLVRNYARTTIDLQEIRITFDGIDQENDNQLILLNAVYSSKACRLDCRLSAIWDTCQCLLPYDRAFYKNSTPDFCKPRQMIDCVRSSNRKFQIDSLTEECTNRNCLNNYDRKKYDYLLSILELNGLLDSAWPKGENINDWTYVYVAHEKLQYEEFHNSWSMRLDEMIGNVGGQIGLWLGFSMCTIFQIPIVLITYLYLKIKNRFKK